MIPVPPCRELCEKSLSDCSSIQTEFGITLPPQLACQNFPKQSSIHTCIPLQSHRLPLPDGTLSWNDEDSSEVVEHQAQCPTTQRSKYSSWSFMEMSSCSQPCSPMNKSDSDTRLIRIVVGLFASLTTVVSAFSIFVFCRDRKRFQYPERPTLFFAMCYLVISLICVIGLVAPDSIVCSETEVNDDQERFRKNLKVGRFY